MPNKKNSLRMDGGAIVKVSENSETSPSAITHYSTADVLNQINAVQSLMKEAMHEGEHFGKIPGCGDKLVLLKPGAEKLAFMFRLAPSFNIKIKEYENGHREYEVTTTLTHIPTGQLISQGVGICSTLESKYRFRYVDSSYKPSSSEAERLKAEGKGKWRKNGNAWIWQEKIEYDNIQDNYNTVLKMAKKRSLVDAVITATAASDIFTQDLEDFADNSESKITPINPELSAKSNPSSSSRNYTEEIESLNSVEELNEYYRNITDDKLKKSLLPLLKQRKEQIINS